MNAARCSFVLALALGGLSGCAGGNAGNYFQFEEGNTWDFFVRNSELNDESWTLAIKDADDNQQGSRGQLYYELTRTYTDDNNPNLEYTDFLRRFNVSADNGGLGEEAPVIAWQYKQVNNDEGLRNENFVIQPEASSDWADAWDFDVDGENGGSDFEFEVTASFATESVQTSLDNYEDTLHVVRIRRTISNSGGNESVLTNTREEWYALDVGLVQYRETGADGLSVEGVLRNTSVAVPE
ncbi:MAG: hypothetical protein KDA24_08775 [Deltaproteobacteria bacterium]|nr:hypothetical protein [Deltaproteobacteria bacterium]